MTRRSQLASLALLVAAGAAAPAHAYRTLEERPALSGGPVVWSSPRIGYHLRSDGAPGVSLASLIPVAEAAFGTWSAPECADLRFEYLGATDSPAAPDDAINGVQWVLTHWAERGFSSDVMATTDLLYEREADGAWRIVEADIYFNAVDYRWSASAGAPDSDRRSIRAVLTHEVGHWIGLLHSCEPGGHDGAPDCDAVSGHDANVMYPLYVGPAHTTLSSDDVAGVCSLYGCGLTTCGPGTVCSAGECREACGERVCRAHELCDADRCVPSCDGAPCPTVLCQSDDDCDQGLECRGHVCTRPGAQLGDPCASDAECTTGACSAGGSCTTACGVTCPSGYACDAESGLCEPERGVLGDMCTAPAHCASRLCLTRSDGTTSTCTRVCNVASDDCPSGYECRVVDRHELCVPLPAGGCAVTPSRSTPPWWLVALPLAVLFASRSSRRTRS